MIKKIRHTLAALIVSLMLAISIGLAVLIMLLVWLGVMRVFGLIF